MSQLIIRPLRDDAEALNCAALIAEIEPWKTIRFSAEQLHQRLTNPKRDVFVAEFESQLAGALILHLDGVLNGYIQTIVVFQKFQCRGFGKQLMQFAEEKIFQQSPNVFLCVTHFNEHAQKFYTQLGYQKVGELENFLQNGVTEILMRKTQGPLLSFPSKV